MARILVIDDDSHIREMLRFLFESEGHEVLEAPEGEAAMRLHLQSPVDLVVTDILMPGKEGVQTIIDFKRDFPGIKIIAISGGGVVGPALYLNLAEKFGAQKAFTKPLEVDKLMGAARELLAVR
jgi:DNA-binding NtrC family response regulator